MSRDPDVPAAAPSVHTQPRRLFSAAVGLAAATSIGYTASYSYESGYLAHFGLPGWLIELSAAHAVVSAIALVGIVTVIRAILEVVPADLTAFRLFVIYVLLPFILLAGGLALAIVLYRGLTNWLRWASIIGLPALGAAGFYAILVRPLRRFATIPRWRDRLRRELELEDRSPSSSALSHLLGRAHRAGYDVALLWYLFYASLFFVLLAWAAGNWQAGMEPLHLVTESPTRLVAIRQYGDRLLCVRMDSAGHVLPRFRILAASDPDREWRLVRTGALPTLMGVRADSIVPIVSNPKKQP